MAFGGDDERGAIEAPRTVGRGTGGLLTGAVMRTSREQRPFRSEGSSPRTIHDPHPREIRGKPRGEAPKKTARRAAAWIAASID